MSYDGKLMRRAMVRFEEAKQRRADALHARERAVYAAVPRIAEIDAALRETMSKLISSALRRGTDPRSRHRGAQGGKPRPPARARRAARRPRLSRPTTSRISPTVPSRRHRLARQARSAPA